MIIARKILRWLSFHFIRKQAKPTRSDIAVCTLTQAANIALDLFRVNASPHLAHKQSGVDQCRLKEIYMVGCIFPGCTDSFPLSEFE